MLLLMSLFLVARLCSVIPEFKFLPVSPISNMVADVFVKRPFSLCLLSLFLVAFSLLRHQSGLFTSRPLFRPKFCRDCVVVSEG